MIHFLRSCCFASAPRFFFAADMPRSTTTSNTKTTRNKSAPPTPSAKLLMPSFNEQGAGGAWRGRSKFGDSLSCTRSGRSPSASQAMVGILEGMESMEAAQKKQAEEQAVVNGAMANALNMITAKLTVMSADATGAAAATASSSAASVPIPVAMPAAPERGVVLPVRGPAPSGPSKRLVGGRARLGHRLDTIGHVVGDLEDDEFEKLSETMTLGAKVEPRTRARLLNVARSRGGSRVTDMLMDAGLMELGGGHGARIHAQEDLLDSVGTVLTEKQKARKGAVAKPFVSFNKLFLKYSEIGFFTRELFELDPASYWSIDWHFKCLTWMDRKHGWRIAGKYHERVMARWNRFDHEERADSLDARAGDWEQACHQLIFMSVFVDPDTTNESH